MRPHVVVLGLMGVGKSTVGAAVAQRLGVRFRDSDRDLESLFGETGAELADAHGVDELHRLEASVLLGALADETPTVIAAAGWTVEDPRCLEAMARRSRVVWLEAGAEVLVQRMRDGQHRRPMGPDEVGALVAARAPLFARAADLTIAATDQPSTMADSIVSDLPAR